MNNLEYVKQIINSYKYVSENIDFSTVSTEQKVNKKRSSDFIYNATINMQDYLKEFQSIEVLSKEIRNKSLRRNEFLFDIHVCEIDKLKSVKNKDITYVKKSIVTVESELDNDTFEVSMDFSKLVCSSSGLKIMVISKSSKEKAFRDSLKKIALNVTGELYLITLPHPRIWNRNLLSDYSIHHFHNNDWCKVQLETSVKQ